ncbi:MAG: DUF2892 domain-containing protein [Leptospiraceae bacterium]|nr:DUF2892 domain-containing protein [Leptospiraceae bacterium]MBK7055878.1 DUF2892 domain-containing protein [Leptospiraceae bacterium]MBK9499288.1 DUF2892 domain-containing protein [Leptospiraceae bacterium]MBP9163685.1 DUF2892 domain-containing protein [Leptospiraceae bacterium]HRG46686.1 DUF2892 domain-containing protein [Leptospiraceae bacterium]
MFLAKTDNWYMERIIWLLAGVFTIASVGLGVFVHPYWLILTGIVGLNQVVLSLTGFCPMTIFLNSLGCKSRIQ